MSVVEDALRSIDWVDRQLLVACSGGLDSTVLLHALVAVGLKPQVLHVNYGLRGADSEADEVFVRELADRYQLKIDVQHCPKELLKGEGINLQAAARDFRRTLFADWKSKSNAHFVVLGHHADDQIETFFLQLFRGSGTFGLGGMHAERDGLIRPFLQISKAELKSYAQSSDLVWREDATNASNAYSRNVWRNELLPQLLDQSPTLRESVLLMTQVFRDRQRDLKSKVVHLVAVWNDSYSIGIAEWTGLETEEQLAFLQAVQLPFWAADRMNELCERPVSSRFDLGQGHMIREKSRLIYHVDRTEKRTWDFKIDEIGILPTTFDKEVIYLDPDKIRGALRLRPWKEGDRIQSKGLNGSQLVSDILKDAGIPLADRFGIQVLTDDNGVLWIPGLKVGRTALADSTSAKVWRVIAVEG